MPRSFLRRTLSLLLFFIPLTLIPGLDWMAVDSGLLYLINTEEDSAPSPLLTTVGMSLPFTGAGKAQ